MIIKKYTFADGKYEIHAADDGSSLVAYRHGGIWLNIIGAIKMLKMNLIAITVMNVGR